MKQNADKKRGFGSDNFTKSDYRNLTIIYFLRICYHLTGSCFSSVFEYLYKIWKTSLHFWPLDTKKIKIS